MAVGRPAQWRMMDSCLFSRLSPGHQSSASTTALALARRSFHNRRPIIETLRSADTIAA